MGIYRSPSWGSLSLHTFVNRDPYISLNETINPDDTIKTDIGTYIQINTQALSFSANGRWMVADSPSHGLLRVDLKTLAVKPFAPRLETNDYGTVTPGQIAISNDGRYVAEAPSIIAGYHETLTVYDLSTCDGNILNGQTTKANCKSKDIWDGDKADHSDGLLGQQPSLFIGFNLRFTEDDKLNFIGNYDKSGSSYKSAKFVITAAGATQNYLGLIGMGDSYISGEGEYIYREGTDTENNLCHLSEVSYPFLLGRNNFGTFNSIACSGAKTEDIINPSDDYKGQVRDKIKAKDRDAESIFNEFQPGFLSQINFVARYQPNTIILSVGGNDMGGRNKGFSSILQPCVIGADTCYNTYDERKQILNQINDTYNVLTKTYASLRAASPTSRIYVIGYPQIAKVDGDCRSNVHLNSDELKFASQVISYLDSVIAKAAVSQGVVYVDTQHALDGERLCEGRGNDIAMNGATVGNDTGPSVAGRQVKIVGNESFHPTTIGHVMLSKAIAEVTDNLTEPMPSPNPNVVKPTFDPNNELLAGFEPTQTYAPTTFTYDDMLGDTVGRGIPQMLSVDGTDAQLVPGGQYQIVLHSTPITLASVTADVNGNISTTITIPYDIEPGFHTVNITGQDILGQSINIQKVIFVPDENNTSTCGPIPLANQDVDKDGIDDGCDPVISDPPVVISSVSTTKGPTPQQTLSSQTALAPQDTDNLALNNPQLNPVVSNQAAEILGTSTSSVITTGNEQNTSPKEGAHTSNVLVAGIVVFVGCIVATVVIRRRL